MVRQSGSKIREQSRVGINKMCQSYGTFVEKKVMMVGEFRH